MSFGSEPGSVSRLTRFAPVLLLAMLVAIAHESPAAASVRYIWSPTAPTSGVSPTLVRGKDGSLYGTVSTGGAFGLGAVFRLKPPLGDRGEWTYSVIYHFPRPAPGAKHKPPSHPESGVVLDDKGRFYGTTRDGGDGSGTVYRLLPPDESNPDYRLDVLYRFRKVVTYVPSYLRLTFRSGEVFGVVSTGGKFGQGNIYRLTKKREGWVYTDIHDFSKPGDWSPSSTLLSAPDGSLYGTTARGGSSDVGSLFQLKQVDGVWKRAVLYSFISPFGMPGGGESPGYYPEGDLAVDGKGGIFGSTSKSARVDEHPYDECGNFYRLAPALPKSHKRPLRWIADLPFDAASDWGKDGCQPFGVQLSSNGDLYALMQIGGDHDYGTILKLTPPEEGSSWNPHVLASFDGAHGGPRGLPTLAANGLVYGTVGNNRDRVWQWTPPQDQGK